MSVTMSPQWEKTLSILRENTDETQYASWIAPLNPIITENDTMLIEVPHTFIINVLKNRFYLLIKNAVMICYGKEYQIEFIQKGELDKFLAAAGVGARNEDVPPERRGEGMLNPKYTFETFVVGTSNRFAHAASLAVAELPSDAYNPLFLYGGVGLGKTHLMHAIGHYILAHNPRAKLLYITSENFTNQLISSIAKKTNEDFRDMLRSVDVLMVDDIQFIAGKTATQEEFFHTFNQLHGNGKQIIISSDRPPKEIPTLEERLRSRFEWGLIADIQRPDYETRIAILRRKAELEHITINDDVLYYIAEKVESNIRELEGSLTRVNAMAALEGGAVNLAMAQEALQKTMRMRGEKKLTPELVMDVVANYYHVSRSDLISQKRNRDISVPRQVAMYLLRTMTPLSTTRIGQAFGGRDHTTVLHACDRIAATEKDNERMRQTLEELKANIQEG